MIAFRDFPYRGPGFFPDASRDRENFEQAVAFMNEWITDKTIDVINVETIGVNINDLLRVVRVWYRATGIKATNIPEV